MIDRAKELVLDSDFFRILHGGFPDRSMIPNRSLAQSCKTQPSLYFFSQVLEIPDPNQTSSTILRFSLGDLNCPLRKPPRNLQIRPLRRQVGVLKVRLFRPWDRNRFMAALPTTTKRICVLDRTKELQGGASWGTWRLE